jgi:hypothetical protein
LKCHILGTQHGHLDITRQVAPNQAQFEPKYFIVLTGDGPTLFNLIGQCFQDVGLTEFNNVVKKQCPNDTNFAKAKFKEWTWNYLKQSPVAQHRRPTDSLALSCKEACIHADTCIYAASGAAI